MSNATSLEIGTVLKLSGSKASVIVVAIEGDCYTVRGKRGDFLLTDCGSHWVRWPLVDGAFRNASPRQCKIEAVLS